jgi:WD40 repeat protein
MERLLCFDLERVNALTLDFHSGKEGVNSMLLYGTDSGHVNVLTFDEQIFLHMAARQKGQIDTIYLERDVPHQKLKQLGTVWRRKAHTDWVLSVRYISELKLIISVSPGSKDALSVAQFGNNHKWNFHHSSINKGLNCFAYCSFPQSIATGGMDRVIRLWNPHRLSSPTSTLIGHPAPVLAMSVNRWSGHLLSICADKHLKIWDIRHQTCLQTIVNAVKQYPENILSCLYFNNDEGGSIITSSNTITKYRLKNSIKVQNEIRSHELPVRKILYNSTFKHLITGCDGSVVNVWVLSRNGLTFS